MDCIDVVCAVIERQGKVLCMRRKNRGAASTAGLFEFPGGKIEAGETPYEAIVREIREELEWEVTPLELLATVTHEYPEFTIRLTAVRCGISDDAEPVLHDHDDYRWLEPAELPSLNWAAADSRLIDKLNLQR